MWQVSAGFVVRGGRWADGRRWWPWPLGVAAGRGFPDVDAADVDVLASRPHACNWIGGGDGDLIDDVVDRRMLRALNDTGLAGSCLVKSRKDGCADLENKQTNNTNQISS